MDLQEVGWGIYWIDLAQEKDRWQAPANAVMNFRLHKMREIFWLAENRSASQGLRSME